tara:strand:+ start:212 stop:445 length:234 start_codon:yes stop_codon:yes gene_type:complete
MPSVNRGAPLAPIYLENPPETLPEVGTAEYELLIREAGPAAAAFDQESYRGHIAATRRPEDYPSFLDPVKDRDVRWG